MNLVEALAKNFRISAEELQSGTFDTRLPVLMEAPTGTIRRHAGRQALGRTMNELECRSGIEIGTHAAESTLEWCQAMPGLQLTCVDPYVSYEAIPRQSRQDRTYKLAQQTIRDSNYNIDLWRMTSCNAVSRFDDESVDFVYIDGDHRFDAVMMDLLLYAPKVRKGGIIALHDYFYIRNGGVVDAVDAYTRAHGIAPWYVTFDIAPTAFWQRGAEKL